MKLVDAPGFGPNSDYRFALAPRYVAGVAVLPHARGRGIAAPMSSWLLAAGFAAGAELAHLHPDTDAAAAMHARLGFVETGGLDVYVDVDAIA